MKHLKIFLALICATVCLQTALATDVVVIDGLKYSLDTTKNTAAVVPNGYSGDIVIPSTIVADGTEYAVTVIYSSAFKDRTGLTSIKIPDSVTIIHGDTFSGCTSLTSVTIGNSVTSIADRAFWACTSLTSINIPNSVKRIGMYAFEGCTGLTSITIGNSVTSIGAGAFFDCTNSESISVSKENTVYDSRDSCNAIIETATNTLIAGCKNAVIPNSVTKIENYAFSECTSLTSIDIPNSVTYIEGGAFLGCTNLESISVSKENTVYDSRDNCNAIIETATNKLIAGCKNTVIPNSVTEIRGSAFQDCTRLTSIEIPNSITKIGSQPFEGCTNLESISVSKENTIYDSRDNCNAIIETATNALIAGCKNTVIPNSVTKIENYAFSECTSLTSIDIPNSVTWIGMYAFQGCTGLTSVTIPNSVTWIGRHAFSGCDSLESVTSLSATPPSLDLRNGVFDSTTYKQATLYVPMGSADAYKSAEGWKDFSNIVEGVPTAIKPINNDKKKTMTSIYDIEGRKLSAPQKGINIINGRKVLVR